MKKGKKEEKKPNIRAYETKKGTRYEYNFSINGIRYTKRGFAGTKEAKKAMTIAQNEVYKNGYIKKECHKTFKQVYDEFLEIGSNKYQENTINQTIRYCKYVEELFERPISKIDYAMLQQLFNKRRNEGLRTNQLIRSCINRIFEFAIDMNYVTENPVKKITVVGIEKHLNNDNVLSEEDFIKLTSALDNETDHNYHAYSVAIKIGYFSGLRPSEIFALDKNDIDFERNIIDVNKKMVYVGKKKSEIYASHQLKNKSSQGIVPLNDILRQVLIDWFEINKHDIIVCDNEGCYIHPQYAQNTLKSYAKRLGISFHFHMLRHTLASNLITGGVDVKTTQEILRHSNVTTTLSIYTHVNEEHKQEEINRIFSSKCGKNVAKTSKQELIN